MSFKDEGATLAATEQLLAIPISMSMGHRGWVGVVSVSEQILNGTSAQLGYRVPFMLVHAGKYTTEDRLKTDTLQKLNTTQKKQTTQNTAEQN